jgi:hypothetical protein
LIKILLRGSVCTWSGEGLVLLWLRGSLIPLCSCVNFLSPPDDIAFLQTAHDIYIQHLRYPGALALAICLSDPQLIASDFRAPGNP